MTARNMSQKVKCDIALLDVNGADYRCTINGISKSDVANSGENADLTKKKAILSK